MMKKKLQIGKWKQHGIFLKQKQIKIWSSSAGSNLKWTLNHLMGSRFLGLLLISSINILHALMRSMCWKGKTEWVFSQLTDIVNECLLKTIFPTKLRMSKLVSVFNKGNMHDVSNCRPVSSKYWVIILCSYSVCITNDQRKQVSLRDIIVSALCEWVVGGFWGNDCLSERWYM